MSYFELLDGRLDVVDDRDTQLDDRRMQLSARIDSTLVLGLQIDDRAHERSWFGVLRAVASVALRAWKECNPASAGPSANSIHSLNLRWSSLVVKGDGPPSGESAAYVERRSGGHWYFSSYATHVVSK